MADLIARNPIYKHIKKVLASQMLCCSLDLTLKNDIGDIKLQVYYPAESEDGDEKINLWHILQESRDK